MLQSRQQRWLTRYFPEVVATLLEFTITYELEPQAG